jgi:hypothetical protein
MRHKLYYKPSINGNSEHRIQILVGDIVKIYGEGDALYKVTHIKDSDINMFEFYRCAIIDIATRTYGANNIFGGKLVFMDREFYDPDHF